ncbi:histidine phosphatase family protein [bacterium]|nr:MAG: histidine phosphatase family protein [bacterium]
MSPRPSPGGESYQDVEHRIHSFVEFLQKNYDGQHIAIMGHHAPQLALEVLLRHRTWPQAVAEDWRPARPGSPAGRT